MPIPIPKFLSSLSRLRNFLKTPTGQLASFAFFVGIVLAFILLEQRDRPAVVESDAVPVATQKTSATLAQPYAPVSAAPTADQARPRQAVERPVAVRPRASAPPPIDLYTSNQPSVSPVYAPYGRLVPCELVVTVDSSRIATPIIGLVTEDVWHDGRLVVPAGTEVHGNAQLDRSRERIASQSNWTLVWQDGRELKVNGIALDRARSGNGWSLTDGSAGLRGRIIKSDSLAEIKLFASTFLSAAAVGFTDQQSITGPFGTTTVVEGTLKNAIATGAAQTLNQYAQQILQRIREDGFYVRVPAGSTFYLYITQTLDQGNAKVAGTQVKEPRS